MRTVSPSWIPACFQFFQNTGIFQELLEESKSFLGIQIGITKHFLDLRSFYDIHAIFFCSTVYGRLHRRSAHPQGNTPAQIRSVLHRQIFQQLADIIQKFFHTFCLLTAGDRKYLECPVARIHAFRSLLPDPRPRHVDQHRSYLLRSPADAVAISAIIGLQFCIDLINIINRIASFCTSGIYHMDQQLGTLDMTQEFMSKTDALRSTLDQSGDICHDKAASVRPDLRHPDSDSSVVK